MAETQQATPPKVARKGAGATGVLIMVMVAVSVLGAVFYAFTMVTGGYLLNAILGHWWLAPLTDVHEFTQAELRPGATGDILDLPLEFRVAAALPPIALAVTALIGGRLAIRLLGAIRAGDAFGVATVALWPKLAAVLLGGSAVYLVAAGAVFFPLHSAIVMNGPRPSWLEAYEVIGLSGFVDLPWIYILLGLLAGVLGMAFRQGAKLQDEVEGVV